MVQTWLPMSLWPSCVREGAFRRKGAPLRGRQALDSACPIDILCSFILTTVFIGIPVPQIHLLSTLPEVVFVREVTVYQSEGSRATQAPRAPHMSLKIPGILL